MEYRFAYAGYGQWAEQMNSELENLVSHKTPATPEASRKVEPQTSSNLDLSPAFRISTNPTTRPIGGGWLRTDTAAFSFQHPSSLVDSEESDSNHPYAIALVDKKRRRVTAKGDEFFDVARALEWIPLERRIPTLDQMATASAADFISSYHVPRNPIHGRLGDGNNVLVDTLTFQTEFHLYQTTWIWIIPRSNGIMRVIAGAPSTESPDFFADVYRVVGSIKIE